MPITNVTIGDNPTIRHPDLVNLYDCTIGDDCMIACFVEIGKGVVIGNRCRIQSLAYIPRGVILEDDVFIGPNTVFTNDKYPPSKGAWKDCKTVVRKGAAIGAGCLILPNIEIGEGAKIGAGAVVTKNVPAGAIWVGVPASKLERPDGYSMET